MECGYNSIYYNYHVRSFLLLRCTEECCEVYRIPVVKGWVFALKNYLVLTFWDMEIKVICFSIKTTLVDYWKSRRNEIHVFFELY